MLETPKKTTTEIKDCVSKAEANLITCNHNALLQQKGNTLAAFLTELKDAMSKAIVLMGKPLRAITGMHNAKMRALEQQTKGKLTKPKGKAKAKGNMNLFISLVLTATPFQCRSALHGSSVQALLLKNAKAIDNKQLALAGNTASNCNQQTVFQSSERIHGRNRIHGHPGSSIQ